LLAIGLGACVPTIEADTLIVNGSVYTGEKTGERLSSSVAIKDDKIFFIGDRKRVKAEIIIDAEGMLVLPGFIDPHTHSFSDLTSLDKQKRRNDNYLFQGVTTVINGNDGFGEPDIAEQFRSLEHAGIGTNTALFIGHGALRKSVMGDEDRPPTQAELQEMSGEIEEGMKAGALGLSTGLFYAPGSFSNTDEIISLAKIVGEYDGIYDSHIRDESNYSIGLLSAIDEVIEISKTAEVPANIAHVKALGTDVWGQSRDIVAKVEAARRDGLHITADQYPWRASGTRISNALLPRWVKAGGPEVYAARLNDPALRDRILQETTENLRRRGGPSSILITSTLSASGDQNWVGKDLDQIAEENDLTPVPMALKIAQNGDARIASFNMNPEDMKRFMQQDWVMTSSDGSTGHPRKHASYPKKYRDYVVNEKWISLGDFIYRSSGLVAETFNLCGRGFLRTGYAADIAIIHPDKFSPKADFQNPERLSEGVDYLFVNGALAIQKGEATDELAGKALRPCKMTGDKHVE